MMHDRGKSDSLVVPKKPPNNAGQPAAEVVEGSGLAKGNSPGGHDDQTQRRINSSAGIERVRQAARKGRQQRFTALLHHVYDVDRLRSAYLALKRDAAAGIDGQTWQQPTNRPGAHGVCELGAYPFGRGDLASNHYRAGRHHLKHVTPSPGVGGRILGPKDRNKEHAMSQERPGQSGTDFDWRAFTPEDSPKTYPDVMADPHHRDLATAKLAVGDPAHDFELPVYGFGDGSERPTGATFHLQKAAAERPVALIFGSYT
jgi:hypothetical protein